MWPSKWNALHFTICVLLNLILVTYSTNSGPSLPWPSSLSCQDALHHTCLLVYSYSKFPSAPTLYSSPLYSSASQKVPVLCSPVFLPIRLASSPRQHWEWWKDRASELVRPNLWLTQQHLPSGDFAEYLDWTTGRDQEWELFPSRQESRLSLAGWWAPIEALESGRSLPLLQLARKQASLITSHTYHINTFWALEALRIMPQHISSLVNTLNRTCFHIELFVAKALFSAILLGQTGEILYLLTSLLLRNSNP